jgi:Tfp pilus assembly protein PilO
MNRNSTALILVILSIGIYFTFTSGQLDQSRAIKVINDEYLKALDNANELTKKRESLLKDFAKISPTDEENLNKMLPSSVDNIGLVIDIKDMAFNHGLTLKGIKASAPNSQTTPTPQASAGATSRAAAVGASRLDISTPTLDTVTVSFSVTAPYQEFIRFLQDIESNLRIMDITRLSITSQDSGIYEFNLELKTYWLRQ